MMFNRSSIAALSAAMILTLSACSGGAQVSAESSASTSASAESASAEASATPTPSPTPTGPSGSEIVLIHASMDVNSDSPEAAEVTEKTALIAFEQHQRLWNAWRHGNVEHTSDEELTRYAHANTLEHLRETVKEFQELSQKISPEGDIIFRDVKTKLIYGSANEDGTVEPNTGVILRYCEDWSNVRSAEGKKFKDPQLTRRVFVVRRSEDNAFVVIKSETLHNGCGNEADATSEATAPAQGE
ncbi:methyl coenzyme M reductase subunit gamma [Rothia mucilaginosa]|uniref:methyl coenzyme M reductase subunit gamma n=1 Tax=Rothia mucilaginosa TaxID=43675 RepID=UPI0028DB1F75|nr:methyl coenzyme M reductase subunit gamma [Rothia mucilaginosa]